VVGDLVVLEGGDRISVDLQLVVVHAQGTASRRALPFPRGRVVRAAPLLRLPSR